MHVTAWSCEPAGRVCSACGRRGLLLEVVWTLIFVWEQEGPRRTPCRWPPLCRLSLAAGWGWGKVHSWSGGFCLAGWRHIPSWDEGKELCEQMCSVDSQNWVQGSSEVWAPSRAAHGSPMGVTSHWGRVGTMSPLWPSAQAVGAGRVSCLIGSVLPREALLTDSSPECCPDPSCCWSPWPSSIQD